MPTALALAVAVQPAALHQCHLIGNSGLEAIIRPRCLYSELTKTSTTLARLAVTCVLSAARRLVLIFVNPL